MKREPLVDLVFGPDNLFALPDMLEAVRRGERLCRTEWQPWEGPVREFVPERWIEQDRVDGVKAYIAITKGCNNHCSFCIVPRTRGREVSRSPEGILREARSMVAQGVRMRFGCWDRTSILIAQVMRMDFWNCWMPCLR